MSEEILFGFHPLRELLRRRPGQVVEVLVSRRRSDRRRVEIEDLCRRHRIPLRESAEAELRRLVEDDEASHNGFVARLGSVAEPVRAGVVDPGFEVLVEDVQDPRNLGALLRVCEGAGVSKVWVRDRGSSPLTPTVARVSAGASEWLDIERVTNTAQQIERHQAAGSWVYGAAAGGNPPWRVDLTGPVLLCFGGEERGLRARTRTLCDGLLGLPMRGRVESLNLATAAAAILFEAVRQRQGLQSSEGCAKIADSS